MGHTDTHTDTVAPPVGDVAAEFHALRSNCGVYSLTSRAKIALTGADRVRWLNGMVTNNIRDLAVGHGVYAFLLNPQGHILSDLNAYNRGDDLLADIDRAQLEKVLGIFDHYIIMDEVEVADLSPTLTAVGLAGPTALKVLRAAGFEVPDQLVPMQLWTTVSQQIPVTLVKPRAEDVYEVWLAPEHLQQLWDALVAQGARPVGADAVELHRIAQGIPHYGRDIRERDLPQETEQPHALHFSKGCYIGQEIVERIRSRGNVHRKFAGFRIDGPLPPPGTKIQKDSKDVGEITSSAVLPRSSGDRPVALGYVRREMSAAGTVLQAGDSGVTVANLPFADID